MKWSGHVERGNDEQCVGRRAMEGEHKGKEERKMEDDVVGLY